jgi:ankyrin repeat protein
VPAEAPAPAVAAAPKEPPAYRRPDNIKELYTRYNDLISAVVMRDRAAVAELLNDGKNPNARQPDGYSALMISVSQGDVDIVQQLLAKGADPNLGSASGRTALSIAQERGDAATAELLRSHGAKR